MSSRHEFADIYREHRQFVWNLASKYATSTWEREEVFQEAFIRIYRYLPKFVQTDRAQVRTWLYKVVVSTAINYLKRQRRQSLIHDLLSFNLQALMPGRQETDDEGEVNRILSPLNPQQRAIVLLREVEELSYEEIADIMNMPLGTIKSTLNRAKQKMKHFLEKEGREYEEQCVAREQPEAT